MNIKGQGHSLTFVQGHSDSTFSNFFPEKKKKKKKSRLIEAKFHNLASMGYWDENLFKCSGSHDQNGFKNLLLRNQEADDIETWYTASGTQTVTTKFI